MFVAILMYGLMQSNSLYNTCEIYTFARDRTLNLHDAVHDNNIHDHVHGAISRVRFYPVFIPNVNFHVDLHACCTGCKPNQANRAL